MRRYIKEQFVDIRDQICNLADKMMGKNWKAAEATEMQAKETQLIREEQKMFCMEIKELLSKEQATIGRQLAEMKDLIQMRDDKLVEGLRARIEAKLREEKLSAYDLLALSEATKQLAEAEQKIMEVYRELPY